jgi:ABC-2 type transport system ATP-binding protein/lipopolysaccharide transport system ATP-binding protein
MTENAVEAEGLSKRFLLASERRTSLKERIVRGKSPAPKTFWALKDATFSVAKGSSLGIIGHNGSGKSTALKVLTGIYRPTSGTVIVNGSVSALLEVGAGFHPELTGRENIRLNATILGFTNREIDRFMDQIIEFADIGEHIDSPLKHYSSGMYVRLGFAVAVMVRPEILIVDEVIAVGDEEFQRKCYDYLYGLRRAGTSLIVVSHGLAQINDLCDEALWLDRGRPQMLDSSRRVTQAYVDSVNAKEAERTRSLLPGGVADALPHRRGTGEVRVTGIEFRDGDGAPLTLASTGDSLRIRIEYSAQRLVTNACFGLSVTNAEGLKVFVIGSDDDSTWTVPPGAGHVELAMAECLLVPGIYTVRTSVSVDGSILDVDDQGTTLTIRPGSRQLGGMYRQPGHWQHSLGAGVTGFS